MSASQCEQEFTTAKAGIHRNPVILLYSITVRVEYYIQDSRQDIVYNHNAKGNAYKTCLSGPRYRQIVERKDEQYVP